MKPKIITLVLPESNRKALGNELLEISLSGRLPAYDYYETHSLINTHAVSVYLANRIKRHLPNEWLSTLSSIDKDGQAPIILFKNLPTNSALQADSKEPVFAAEYLLRGISQLLGKSDLRKKILLDSVEDIPGRPDRGIGYHRDGADKDLFAKSPFVYSLLLCDSGNTSAATYFVSGKNKGISYRQPVTVEDQEKLDAQPAVLESGDLCVFLNNELVHGRISRAKIDPHHLRRLTSALVSLSEGPAPDLVKPETYPKNPSLERMLFIAHQELELRNQQRPSK